MEGLHHGEEKGNEKWEVKKKASKKVKKGKGVEYPLSRDKFLVTASFHTHTDLRSFNTFNVHDLISILQLCYFTVNTFCGCLFQKSLTKSNAARITLIVSVNLH